MPNITVACKLPNGVTLNLGDTKVELKGARDRDAVAGFGLTEVDEGFWSIWTTQHKDFVPLKKGMIFAQPKAASAAAEAKEKKDIKTGLEGMNPEKPGANLKPEKYEGMPGAKE